MKKAIIVLILVVIFGTCDFSHGATSDYQLAKNWANKHGGGYTIEKVITTAQGGYKGKVKGTRYTVRYPKKVAKGKTVKVYMIEKKDDVKAMACLGVVK